MDAPYYGHLIKTNKHNISTKEAPKMAIIRDYWDKETVTEVVYFLKEYEDLFPQRFYYMKWIVGSLRAMKIKLNPNAKPIKISSYHLNPSIREKCARN
jgi:hypothetical protein